MTRSNRVNSVKPSQVGQHSHTESTQLTRVNSVSFFVIRMEYSRMHASESRLGNDITKSYLPSLHKAIQVAFQSQGTVGIGEPCGVEYLVGVQFLND
ncbi:hypothetical protein Hdeb2414_s0005g00157931 [Helianthus debilis subsp. tardiflorus]